MVPFWSEKRTGTGRQSAYSWRKKFLLSAKIQPFRGELHASQILKEMKGGLEMYHRCPRQTNWEQRRENKQRGWTRGKCVAEAVFPRVQGGLQLKPRTRGANDWEKEEIPGDRGRKWEVHDCWRGVNPTVPIGLVVRNQWKGT